MTTEETVVSKAFSGNLTDLVAAWAERTPDATAVQDENLSITYRRLVRLVDETASVLSAHSIGPESLVAVSISRSAQFIVAALAIERVGACYVPIDPQYPIARQQMMLADSGSELILTTTDSACQDTELPVLRLAEIAAEEAVDLAEDANHRAAHQQPTAAAYVMYTSGSTGVPKGVEIPRAAIANLVCNNPELAIAPGDRVGHLAPTAFDAATFEIWAPLCRGGCVVILPDARLSPTELGVWLRSARLDWLFLTSGLFHLQMEHDPGALAHVGVLITGGDILSPQHVDAAAAIIGNRVYAAYGPTETTVFASLHRVDTPTGDRVPLGQPLSGTEIHILDSSMRPVGDDEVGEIYIGGEGLARGYHGRPGLTADRFQANPYSTEPGARLYRTGDLACRRPSGQIEFHGRADRQVKIRGFRVELGEIEAVLQAHELVSAAVASVSTDAYGKRIVVEVAPVAGAHLTGSDLREWAVDRLPEYMCPHNYVLVDRLELDAHGKVRRSGGTATVTSNRKSLASGLPAYQAPATDQEKLIVNVFLDVLMIDRVGRHDNFFELGGDSLRSVRAIEELRRTGAELSARQFFAGPTAVQLAQVGWPTC
jgi:amino acid adenylation domain-containing protein